MPCISIALPVVVRFSGTKIEKLRAAVAAAIEENVPEFADDAQRWPIQDYCDDEEIGPMFTMEFAGRVLKVSYRPAQAIWWVELGEGIDPLRYQLLAGRPLNPQRVSALRAQGAVETTASGWLRVTNAGFPVLDAVVADLAA